MRKHEAGHPLVIKLDVQIPSRGKRLTSKLTVNASFDMSKPS